MCTDLMTYVVLSLVYIGLFLVTKDKRVLTALLNLSKKVKRKKTK